VVNVLTQSGVVRSDIRSSFGSASGTAAGVPLTIKLQIVNANNNCAALAGAAVYLWHCDRDGNYSLYSNGVTNQNYLRGVQETDSSNLTFTTIYPGCYSGRVPHVHFEVYPSLAKATSASNRIKTSQFTFPVATSQEVRHHRLQRQREEPGGDQLCHRRHLQRRLLAANGHHHRQRHRWLCGDADRGRAG
jgi:protocatechuate 3,4-dioxygenase beta subunit